jgi:Glycosyltransferase
LIKAFSEAFKNDKSVFLQIIGEGTKRTALQALIDQLGLQNQVKLLGMKTRIEIFEIMKDCDAFALASRNETFGVSYVEALSTGLPCIATLCGGPDEFMEDKMGYSIPIDDKSALSQALKDMKLKCYDFDSKEISDTCRSSFSGNHISEQIIAQYDDLLQGK